MSETPLSPLSPLSPESTTGRRRDTESSQMKFGLRLKGLPKTAKYDKLLEHLTGRRSSPGRQPFTELWKGAKPTKVTLFSEMSEGKKMTTGEALFIFPDTEYLGNLSCGPHVRRANGFRIDKSHTLSAERVLVCNKCMTDISFKFDHSVTNSSANDQSLSCEFSCQDCSPTTLCCCCTGIVLEKDVIFKSGKYQACSDCAKDREKQEKWRMTEGREVFASTTNAVVYKHLPDELIAQEQARMGGKPYEPLHDDNPFSHSCLIEELLDCDDINYWPYEMSAYEYLQYQERLAFENPVEAMPDMTEESIYTKVTNDNMEDYWRRMTDLQEKYEFKSLSNIGSMPTSFMKDGQEFRLIPDMHGLICDDPMCQEIAKDQDDIDGGAYAAIVLTSLPLFTNRTGAISGAISGDMTEEEAGPGQEFCLACISK